MVDFNTQLEHPKKRSPEELSYLLKWLRKWKGDFLLIFNLSYSIQFIVKHLD